ncbi:MAG: tetratricopeptide repeat protein [bacterium]|nr:tetratricopeptide repeat protein [bacterium]
MSPTSKLNWRSYTIEIVFLLITVLILFFLFLLNSTIKDIHFDELKGFLQQKNRDGNGLDHIGLVMNYRLHKKSYEEGCSQNNSDLVEMRVNSILAYGYERGSAASEEKSLLAKPVITIINFFRFTIGKEPVGHLEQGKALVNLDIAYYYERNKFYKRSIDIYKAILEQETLDNSVVAGILLHQGYCNSIMGNYNEAVELYTLVIKDYGNEKAAITAAILLRYLEGFTTEIKRIIKEEKLSINKGKKLYDLIAYREALDVFLKVEKIAGRKERSTINYYKGRCYEELASKNKALQAFQEIITSDPKSEYARYSNRRIYMAGALAYNGETLKELSQKNNRVLKDDVLSGMEAVNEQLNAAKDSGQDDAYTRALEKIEKTAPVFTADELKKIERIIQKADSAIEESPGTVNSTRIGKTYEIYTRDGQIMKGTIVRETKDFILLKNDLAGLAKIKIKEIKNIIFIL